MSEGGLFCIPYQVQRPGETPEQMEARNKRILDVLCDHPHWYGAPMEKEKIRESAAWMLTHPEHVKYEIWLRGKHVGMLHLSRILPGVDALLHFALDGVSPLTVRGLIWKFLGSVCFGQLDLQRVSFEVPEHIPTLIKFMRAKLDFRLEGELDLEGNPLGKHLGDTLKSPKLSGKLHMVEPYPSIARLGSRRERAFWDGEQFRDVILLRLLRAEFDQLDSLRRADSRADEPLQEPSVVPRSEASRILPTDPPGPSEAPG